MASETADVADRHLIENGTFLRSERSLLCRLYGLDDAFVCKTYGIDARFQIVWEYGPQTTWMVDTFNETKKIIRLNFSGTKNQKMHHLVLEIMYFIGSSTVCGVFHHRRNGKRFWFNGNFNDVNYVLHIAMITFLNDFNHPSLDTQTQPPTLTGLFGSSFFYYNVDLANGNLSEVNITDMHRHLLLPIIRNDKLYGFPYAQNGSINTKKLWEISLVDGSAIEHKVEDISNVEIRNNLSPFLWINDKLLVVVFDRDNKVSSIFKFDITQMKWEKTKIKVEGRAKSMNVGDGMLIVHAVTGNNGSNQIYRFQYEAVDSLANLVWLSMQRYSLQNPSFHDWFLSKVPKNHKLRSLWNNRKRRHD